MVLIHKNKKDETVSVVWYEAENLLAILKGILEYLLCHLLWWSLTRKDSIDNRRFAYCPVSHPPSHFPQHLCFLENSFLDKYLSFNCCPFLVHFFQGSCRYLVMGYTKPDSKLRGIHDSQCTDQDGTPLRTTTC